MYNASAEPLLGTYSQFMFRPKQIRPFSQLPTYHCQLPAKNAKNARFARDIPNRVTIFTWGKYGDFPNFEL